MTTTYMIRNFILTAFALLIFWTVGAAQTTEFTYQGQLQNSSSPASGSFDFEFLLFDQLTAGVQQGATLACGSVAVTNGTFAVKLDFGASFPGAARFLEIHVKQTGGGAFTPLTPRQPVSNTPYAVKSLNADTATNAINASNATTATNATQLGGVAAGQYVVTTDPRLTDLRAPTAGSPSYIQNQNTGTQPTSNFDISGTGTAGIFNAGTQFNIAGNRVFSITGTSNTFVGRNTGTIFSGPSNSFFGNGAGAATNQNGSGNSFFGDLSGNSNALGSSNSFFGASSGQANLSSSFNSFFGASSGQANTAGGNSFLGASSGMANTTGQENAFFGHGSGQTNISGNNNAFFGALSGVTNSTGNENSFFGEASGSSNTGGTSNSFFGFLSGNSNTNGNNNSIFGWKAGFFLLSGSSNSFLGSNAGLASTGSSNTYLGADTGGNDASGSNNTLVGANANVSSGALTFATAIGSGSVVTTSNTIQIGRAADRTIVGGILRISGLGSGGGSSSLCLNANLEVAACSSSKRYKKNINSFSLGLDLIRKLHPVSFDWKAGGMHDMGLVAEDVAAIEPLLTTVDKNGEVEGVKYDRVGVVLINAVKEQQAQIEAQRKQIENQNETIKKQRADFEALRTLVCAQNSAAAVCKP